MQQSGVICPLNIFANQALKPAPHLLSLTVRARRGTAHWLLNAHGTTQTLSMKIKVALWFLCNF